MSQPSVTSGINVAFDKFLRTAIEKNSSELLNSVLSFIRRVCRDSIQYRKLNHFNDYIYFPTRIYLLLHSKQRANSIAEVKFSKGYIEILSLHLKEVIWFDINIFGKNARDIADKSLINQFYRSAFQSFSNFLYTVISLNDWQTFNNALVDYNGLSEGVFDNNYQINYELKRLKQEANFDSNNKAVKRLQLEVDTNNKYQEYKRQVLSGIKYWLIFLYSENVINSETLEKTLVETGEGYTSIEDDSKDILKMRSDFSTAFDWGSWDHIQRESGKVYFPPMVSDWTTLGFLISRLRERKLAFIVDELSPAELNDVPFLYDKLASLKQIVLRTYERWIGIVHVESQEELQDLINKFILQVGQAKRRNVGHRETTIASADLSDRLIAEFQQKMVRSWQKEIRIRQLFKHFENFEDVSNEEIKLKFVGQRNFFEKAKMLFIEGEFHSEIYGLEQLGGQIGRNEDDLFFHIVKNSAPEKITAKSMSKLLEDGLSKLRSAGRSPNAIFMEPEYGYKDDELLNHPLFSTRPIISESNGVTLPSIGSFDGVTIFWSFSRSLKNHALIAEFESAFQMLFKSNDERFDHELQVLVEPISKELAAEKLRNEPMKWRTTDEGIELSEDESMTIIETSVIIEIGTLLDFRVIDKSKFVFGDIASPIAD